MDNLVDVVSASSQIHELLLPYFDSINLHMICSHRTHTHSHTERTAFPFSVLWQVMLSGFSRQPVVAEIHD